MALPSFFLPSRSARKKSASVHSSQSRVVRREIGDDRHVRIAGDLAARQVRAVAAAADLRDVLSQLDAGGLDRGLHRMRLLVIGIEREQRVGAKGDHEGEHQADPDAASWGGRPAAGSGHRRRCRRARGR